MNILGKQKLKAYDAENLKYLGVCLNRARSPKENIGEIPPLKVNTQGLERAVRALPKEDRETVEKFWGLTGGPNHSRKSGLKSDLAFVNMFKEAVKSMRKLFWIDYIRIYDENFEQLIQIVMKKTNKNGVTYLSDIEAIKYLVGFFILIWNGPKMSYEEDLLEFDTDFEEEDATCDEYAIIKDMCRILDGYPDNSVNLQLLVSFFEMMRFEDKLLAKNCVSIDISEDCKYTSEPEAIFEIKRKLGSSVSREPQINPKQIETVKTFCQIRRLKEQIFKYGAWNITSALIIGNTVNIQDFAKTMSKIYRYWSWGDKLEEFKIGEQIKLRVSTGIRNLDVYHIGGLEFTDPEEIDFLYISREMLPV